MVAAFPCSSSVPPFFADMPPAPVRQHDVVFRLYESEAGTLLDVAALVAAQPADAHVYVCGPQPLNDAAVAAAQAAGWDASRIHFEQFRNDVDATGGAFDVTLRKSGKTLHVGPGDTLLRVIEKAGIKVDCMCREGMCGSCETVIADGVADHRDS